MKNLTVEQSHHERQANSSIPLIDVRTPAEYGSLHAESAQSHPMESLDMGRLSFFKGSGNSCHLPVRRAFDESMSETGIGWF